MSDKHTTFYDAVSLVEKLVKKARTARSLDEEFIALNALSDAARDMGVEASAYSYEVRRKALSLLG